jgi:hypothetical protein
MLVNATIYYLNFPNHLVQSHIIRKPVIIFFVTIFEIVFMNIKYAVILLVHQVRLSELWDIYFH